MKQKWYINRIGFRIVFPALAGLVLYLTLLMVFGNLEDLSNSFFSQEAFFMIVLSYVTHEWTIFLLGRRQSRNALNSHLIYPKFIYYLVMLITTILINTFIILIYFIFLIGYNYYMTELITINVLLILLQLMVHLYYISMLNIRRFHELSMESEEIQGKQLEIELESFKSEMNPGLLLECLESLLVIMKKDVAESERYIQALSNQYRYLLNSRKKEFAELEDELKAVREMVYLLNNGGPEKLVLVEDIQEEQCSIIPGAVLNIILQVENSMILNPMNPLKIYLNQDDKGVTMISHENQPRLTPGETVRMDKLNQSYEHYSGNRITRENEGSMLVWKIPGLPEIVDETN